MTPLLFRLGTVAAAALLTACANLAPDYQRPAAPVPTAFPQAGSSAEAGPGAAAERPWRSQFSDERLQRLIELALAHNRDLRIAVLNIEQARAQYRVQDAARLPTLQAAGSGTQARTPADLSATGRSVVSHSYSATLGTTAFELDFFGRTKNLSEQALQQFLATEEARRATQITVVAEVAQAYFTWAADLQRLQLAQDTYKSYAETVTLTQRRVAAGADSMLTLRQQQTSAETARGQAATLRATVAQDRQALALLVGTEVPDALAPAALAPDADPGVPDVPAGLPSELLLRRPDLLQSERSLKAATANIGVARAAFYPSISLTATAGSASADLGRLFKGGQGSWSFVPQVSLPIFDGGANRANLTVATTARDIAVARYEQAIQTAFREVADALAVRASVGERLAAQQALVEASGSALELARARQARGLDSWLQVLDAQRTYDSARQGLIDVRLDQASNGITLYKSLGGGAV
ncbi:efflux transporter outer membrane subunit [Aquincola tertiaricarbonis]|uniref:Efflux transporter outer membrane subunit n=1 Tax=Aquincola tertiaricarbonis TaxID=391953 RepID=A0ABY4S598_AQUTE|nr:efflux transporter outer membrane subunit [Aquincola tertiaricarbonis]URI07614.1 efflux transporter outer membrane subunit [Aquincola tertiaricarbonis]